MYCLSFVFVLLLFFLGFLFPNREEERARKKKRGTKNILVSIDQIKDDALFDSTDPERNAAQLGALPMHFSHERRQGSHAQSMN